MHRPAFEQLCDLAEEAHLQIRLYVGDCVETEPGEERRELSWVEIWSGETPPIAGEPVYNGDLEAAATLLLARTA